MTAEAATSVTFTVKLSGAAAWLGAIRFSKNRVRAYQLTATIIPISQSLLPFVTNRVVAATVQVLALDRAKPRIKAKRTMDMPNIENPNRDKKLFTRQRG